MRCVRDGRETHGTFAVQRQGRFHSLLRGRAPRDGHAERLKPAVALPQAATGLGEPELGQASRARAGAAAAALCPRSAYLPLATARRGGGPPGPGDASLSRCDRREDCETGRARTSPWLTRFGVRDWRWKNTLDTATNSCTAER